MNEIWDVQECIDYMPQLAEFKPWFIEEPTSPGEADRSAMTVQSADRNRRCSWPRSHPQATEAIWNRCSHWRG